MRFVLLALAWVWMWGQEPVPTPVAGQPIAFAADHSGTCAPSTLTSCKTTYQLYVNGVKVGAEVPISSTPGVVAVTISGLSAGNHTAQISAIARGTDIAGKAVTLESSRSATLTFTVLPAGPAPPPTMEIPYNIRLEWPAPPPDLGDGLIDSQSNWVLNGATGLEASLSVSAHVGQTVLLTLFQPSSGTRTYTPTASNAMLFTPAATALTPGSTRGIQLWKGIPATSGSITVTVRANTTASFRISALVLNTTNMDSPWTHIPTADTTIHACGPQPWPMAHDGNVLCVVLLNSASNVTPSNAAWIPPTTGSLLGGWLTRSAGETEDGQIQFTTKDARRPNKIALRVW